MVTWASKNSPNEQVRLFCRLQPYCTSSYLWISGRMRNVKIFFVVLYWIDHQVTEAFASSRISRLWLGRGFGHTLFSLRVSFIIEWRGMWTFWKISTTTDFTVCAGWASVWANQVTPVIRHLLGLSLCSPLGSWFSCRLGSLSSLYSCHWTLSTATERRCWLPLERFMAFQKDGMACSIFSQVRSILTILGWFFLNGKFKALLFPEIN